MLYKMELREYLVSNHSILVLGMSSLFAFMVCVFVTMLLLMKHERCLILSGILAEG